MCLVFLSLQSHPTYKLILAANRDEFYNRQTAPAAFWHDHPEIVGGRDLEASGTWMAMNRNGKIAMVTNYRDFKNIKEVAPSRGALVINYLTSSKNPTEYLHELEARSKHYNGFSLIVGDANELYYLSNYKTGFEKIANGVHGLSNAFLDSPWPKVELGKKIFSEEIQSTNLEAERLFAMLYNEQRADDHLLPQTGVGIERERMLSSMFIKSPNYGTRCSTVLLIDKSNTVTYTERVYDLHTFEHTTQSFEFSL